MSKLKTRRKNLFLLAILLLPVALWAQDQPLQPSEIPAAIQSYIKSYFPTQTITRAEVETKRASKEYEIRLSDRTKLSFNEKNQVTKVERKTALPDGIVPPKVRDYVKANYPNNSIKGWKLKRGKQEIELNNDLDLEFTLDGTFLRVDD